MKKLLRVADELKTAAKRAVKFMMPIGKIDQDISIQGGIVVQTLLKKGAKRIKMVLFKSVLPLLKKL